MKLNQVAISGQFAGNIESRVHALRIELRKAKGSDTSGQVLLDLLTDEVTLKIDKGTQAGVITKIYKIGLLDLMTVCIPEGGFVTAKVDGSNLLVTGAVVLSRDGAELLSGDEYYKVTVEGLPDGVTADIYVMDALHDAMTELEYSPVRVNANAPKQIQISQAAYIAIPKEGINQVDLQSPHGTVTYLPAELAYITEAIIPQGFLVDGNTVPGGNAFYILPVLDCLYAKIDSDEDNNIIVISEKGL